MFKIVITCIVENKSFNINSSLLSEIKKGIALSQEIKESAITKEKVNVSMV